MNKTLNNTAAASNLSNKKKILRYDKLYFWIAVIVFVALYAATEFMFSNGAGFPQSLINLFYDRLYLIVAATGVAFVMISGGVDLSVVSTVALVFILSATLINGETGQSKYAYLIPFKLNAAIVIPIMLLLGCIIGLINGLLIHYLKLKPVIVTLVTGLVIMGAANTIINYDTNKVNDDLFKKLIEAKINITNDFEIPLSVIAVLILIAVSWLFLKNTRFGRTIYAIGKDEKSAKNMGLNVIKAKISVYVISGGFAALAGLIYLMKNKVAMQYDYYSENFYIIAACIIGGILLKGGYGNIFGPLIGILIQGTIYLLFIRDLGISSLWGLVSMAVITCLFIIIQKTHRTRIKKINY